MDFSFVWLLGAAIVGYQVVYRCFVLRAKKQDLVYKLKLSAVGLFSYGAGVAFLQNSGLPVLQVALVSALAGMGIAQIIVRRPRRSRYIPADVKRRVIAHYEKNGGKFNPSLHHLDHIVPYAEGGDHSVGNLRVLSKEKNLAKSAKAPKLRDFLRRSG
jgi:hypothetical protein